MVKYQIPLSNYFWDFKFVVDIFKDYKIHIGRQVVLDRTFIQSVLYSANRDKGG